MATGRESEMRTGRVRLTPAAPSTAASSRAAERRGVSPFKFATAASTWASEARSTSIAKRMAPFRTVAGKHSPSCVEAKVGMKQFSAGALS